MAATVQDILRKKGKEVVTVLQDTSAYEALQLMQDKKIGALVVTDETDQIVGIVSERDYNTKIILQKRPVDSTTVAEIMTRDIYGATPSKTVNECMAIMLQEHIRHLPVFEDGRIVGLISIGDTVKSIVKQQRVEIRYLTSYIAGNTP